MRSHSRSVVYPNGGRVGERRDDQPAVRLRDSGAAECHVFDGGNRLDGSRVANEADVHSAHRDDIPARGVDTVHNGRQDTTSRCDAELPPAAACPVSHVSLLWEK